MITNENYRFWIFFVKISDKNISFESEVSNFASYTRFWYRFSVIFDQNPDQNRQLRIEICILSLKSTFSYRKSLISSEISVLSRIWVIFREVNWPFSSIFRIGQLRKGRKFKIMRMWFRFRSLILRFWSKINLDTLKIGNFGSFRLKPKTYDIKMILEFELFLPQVTPKDFDLI